MPTVWAKFTERQREGQKFVVAERPGLRAPRLICSEDLEVVAQRRRRKAEFRSEEFVCFAGDEEASVAATSSEKSSPLSLLFEEKVTYQ